MNRTKRLATILLKEIKIRKSRNENLSKDPLSDAIIRQIGNLLILPEGHSGRAASGWQKETNRRLSVKAKAILDSSESMAEFHKKTHNEHQLPVSNTHKWIVENCETLTVDNIIEKIYSYPMTTITWEEESKLTTVGNPTERYEAAGIKIVMLEIMPKEHFKQKGKLNEIHKR
jgi:hypothetical protein